MDCRRNLYLHHLPSLFSVARLDVSNHFQWHNQTHLRSQLTRLQHSTYRRLPTQWYVSHTMFLIYDPLRRSYSDEANVTIIATHHVRVNQIVYISSRH